MKILFYHYESKLEAHQLYDGFSVYAKYTVLYLKTYLEIKKPDIASQVEWCIPQQLKLSDDELIDLINKEKPDLFCTTHYIWNYQLILAQLERIRHRVDPNVLFITGGPSVDVNIDPDYFKKYSFVDYAFYGSGEKAFAKFLECLIENKPLEQSVITNMAWPDSDRKAIVAEYEYVPQLKISPYLHNRDFLREMTNRLHQQRVNSIMSYELTRGCPYTCTFCDWNSGFGNKTTRRKESYKDEIDLFQELGLTGIFLSDANLGQYQEDLDMVKYFAGKNINEGVGFSLDYTVSKLRKENNLIIFHDMAKANLCPRFVISVQDSNKQILENIDRPDVGWEVHTSHIRELYENYPHIPAVIQLIQGLPGQTPESWRGTLAEVTAEDNVTPLIYVNEVLSASPAGRSQEYKDKWQYVYSYAERWDYMAKDPFQSPFAMSCVSFTENDFVEMTLLSLIYSSVKYHIVNVVGREFGQVQFNVERIVDEFLTSDIYFRLKDNLLTNWLEQNKFYWTVDSSGIHVTEPFTACSMPLCNLVHDLRNHKSFLQWTIKGLSPTTQNKKEYARYVFDKIQGQNEQ
jgi:putative methyltransferase